MRICIIDTFEGHYDPQTPFHSPLGGMQSAVCYLSRALVAQGHDVFLYNNCNRSGVVDGVLCMPLSQEVATLDHLISRFEPDAIIVNGGAQLAPVLRPKLTTQAPWYFWTGHSAKQPFSAPLAQAECQAAWDAFLFVGTWQSEQYQEHLGLPPERCYFLRNAMAESFERADTTWDAIAGQKTTHPSLIYTSTPFRGLEVLARAFPKIRNKVPDCELHVYSSMKVYQEREEAAMETLYQMLRQTRGVHYYGSVSQSELVQAMHQAWVLAYPCIFDETSCIAVMEAMASGCQVVSSHRAALPETTAGYAELVTSNPDTRALEAEFVSKSVDVLEKMKRGEYQERLQEQLTFTHQHYTWSQRARELVTLLSELNS